MKNKKFFKYVVLMCLILIVAAVTALSACGIQGEKGEKGEKGDQGEPGIQGEQGIQGEKGEKGDQGEPGIQGEQGIQGEKGDKGDQGEPGKDGATWIVGTVAPNGTQGKDGDLYLNSATFEVYRKENGTWTLIGDINGDDAQEIVTVTFDAAGGELDENTLTVNKGEYTVLPEPTRSGYIFDGWYYGTGVNAGRFTNTTPIYGDITLTASWIGDFTEGLAYVLNEDGQSYSCTGMGTYEGNTVKIAPDYNGLPVTAVAANAFAEEQSIEKVVIPDSIIRIDSKAFYKCSLIDEIHIGKNVEYFGSSAFSNDIKKPNKHKIYFNGTVADWCEINFDGVRLIYPYGTLYLNNEPVVDLVIPDGVTEIKRGAFTYCSSLKSVSIPNSVTNIGNETFGACVNLKELVIPDSVESIGQYAFTDCYSLAKVTLGSGVTNIQSNAFDHCNNLVEVYNRSELNVVAGSEEFGKIGYNAKNVYTDESGSNIITEGDYIFYNDVGEYYLMGYTGDESEIELPTSVDGKGYGIYQYAFYDCDSLISVVIPEGVKSIGDHAFSRCDSLTSVIIPDSVTSIGDYAFSSCGSLTSVIIPDGVTSIGDSTFSYCGSLTSVIIPDSVTSIGGSAFRGCVKLENVYYGGTSDEWAQINISYDNDELTSAKIYYYSAEQSTGTGNYWRYADGIVTVW